MQTYWQIIPRNDPYSYIGLDSKGAYVVLSKADSINTTLLFSNKFNAKLHIKTALNENDYSCEKISIDESYLKEHARLRKSYTTAELCPICGRYQPDGAVCTLCLKRYDLYEESNKVIGELESK